MHLKNNNIKVSVIVPVYNVEEYLYESILSILNQTLKDIEIILINDGSTDSSLSIMKDLAKDEPRIKIFSQPNCGQSIARNIGLTNALGTYIYFFDSDDILEPNTLEECYLECQSNDLDLLFFDGKCFGESIINEINYYRTNKFRKKIYKGIDILKQQIKEKGFSASPCLSFIRRNYLIDINLFFYPRIIHEDALFTFILYLKANKVSFINKCYFHRRIRANSTMTSLYSTKNAVGYLTVCKELFIHYRFSLLNEEKKIIKQYLSDLINFVYTSSIKYLSKQESRQITSFILHNFLFYLKIKHQIKILIPTFLLRLYYKKAN